MRNHYVVHLKLIIYVNYNWKINLKREEAAATDAQASFRFHSSREGPHMRIFKIAPPVILIWN